ncbi:hypothetical protein PLIIFM63780_005647 [Purpureocillium lilacinum]|nr:hypothetical protein PLIIFM63780_005647 [Purpureocillium lilacinum]
MPPASSSMGHANDAMDGERLSNESILSGEWSSNEDILNEYGYDPASMKRRAEKSMAHVRELYDEGKPLFTREMIEDTQRQIDEIKSGEPPSMTTLSVIGMDGKRHENLWATIVHDNEVSDVPVMSFHHIQSLTEPTSDEPEHWPNRLTPITVNSCSRSNPYSEEAKDITAAQVAAGWDSCIEDFSRTETWRMLQVIFNGASAAPRLDIDKIVGFGLGNLTVGSMPHEDPWERTSGMQHALLVSLADLLEKQAGRPVRRIVQEPIYLDTCKEALRARGVEIAEPETGFLLVDERTLVITVSCNVPVRQIVADLARPAGMIWNRVEPEERRFSRGSVIDEDGELIEPYTTDEASPRVRDLVKGYTEHQLPEEDDEWFNDVAVYIRKEMEELV